MASSTEIMDQYVRDSRYGTSSKVPQAGKKKSGGGISGGGTAALDKGTATTQMVDFKKMFGSM